MADQNPSDAPSLPPIPTIPFQGTPLDQPAPSTPTEIAAASVNSSINNDVPISEVVTALKSAPQMATPSVETASAMPVLTEIKTETPSPAASAPAATTTTVTVTPPPAGGPTAETAPSPAPQTPAPASPPAAVTTTVSVNPPPAGGPETPKGPLYEDPDKVKVPGAS